MNSSLSLLFGGSADKLPDVLRSASPVFHVARTNAPFLIVHGTRDSIVPVAQAQELCDKLQEAGVPASLVKIEDGQTFETPEARRSLAMESLLFLNR